MRNATTYLPSFLLLAVLLIPLSCNSCKKQEQKDLGPKYETSEVPHSGKIYRFAVLPNQTTNAQFLDYQPLIDHLNRHCKFKDVSFLLITSKDFPSFEAKIKAGSMDFLLPNPWETLEAMKVGYNVIAMAGDPRQFKGLLVARQDSKIQKPADLKGKAVSYPAPTSLAACIMVQYFLHQQGIDVNTEINNYYVGSLSSAIMNVYIRETDAAGTSQRAWTYFQKDHPNEATELKVLWETPSLVNNSIMAHKDVPPDIVEKVRRVLLMLHEDSEGRKILENIETDRMLAASNKDYDLVRNFVARFENEVRLVKR